MFSNNPDLQSEATQKGWTFVFINRFALDADEVESSIQAKYVKFLQFLDDYREFATATAITYFDHKFHVKAEHIRWIRENCQPSYDILIRETPRLKASIDDEIADAMGQARYRRNMSATIEWLDTLISTGQIQRQTRIVNTGLIHYANIKTARILTDLVYQRILALGQPECQIIWAAIRQLAAVKIQQVPWTHLEPIWLTP